MGLPNNKSHRRTGTVLDAGLHRHPYDVQARSNVPGQPWRYVTHEKGGWIQLAWQVDTNSLGTPCTETRVRFIQVTRTRALQAMAALAYQDKTGQDGVC
jgi:hypothetical protein